LLPFWAIQEACSFLCFVLWWTCISAH
jgi:hypothetical protein